MEEIARKSGRKLPIENYLIFYLGDIICFIEACTSFKEIWGTMGFKTGSFFDYEQWNEYFGLSGPWLGGKSIRYTTPPPLHLTAG